MKKIFIPIIFGCLALMASCTDGFDEMKTSKTTLTQENLSMKSVFARTIWKGMSADYQRNYNLYDDEYAHYFANCTKDFKSGNYEYNDGWAECGWWEFYDERQKEFNDIDSICGSATGEVGMKAMNDIFNCFMWLRTTDRWGDIPYTGASKKSAVAFMTQKEIYLDLLKRLDADCTAIANEDETQYDPAEYDLVYGYNSSDDFATRIGKWKKLGYSLMLRMAMRISNIDPGDARTYAAKANAGGTFTSIDDNAHVTCDASIWEDYYDRIITNWNNATTDMDFMNYMRGATTGYARANTVDPRCPLWFTKGNYGYVGFQNGLASANYPTDYSWNNYATINVSDAGFFKFDEDADANNRLYYPIENYSEVCFLKAEAALRGYIGGDAEAYYKEGIQASMKEVEANSGTASISDDDITTYIEGLPAWGGSNEAKLKLIAVQKWIALFPNSQEGWSEFRRTGYPDDLTYPQVSSSAIVTDGCWIQRISYPNNEYDYNSNNMPSAYQKGGANYAKRESYGVWWSLAGDGGTFKKGTAPANKF
jgi:hypothetical protein